MSASNGLLTSTGNGSLGLRPRFFFTSLSAFPIAFLIACFCCCAISICWVNTSGTISGSSLVREKLLLFCTSDNARALPFSLSYVCFCNSALSLSIYARISSICASFGSGISKLLISGGSSDSNESVECIHLFFVAISIIISFLILNLL